MHEYPPTDHAADSEADQSVYSSYEDMAHPGEVEAEVIDEPGSASTEMGVYDPAVAAKAQASEDDMLEAEVVSETWTPPASGYRYTEYSPSRNEIIDPALAHGILIALIEAQRMTPAERFMSRLSFRETVAGGIDLLAKQNAEAMQAAQQEAEIVEQAVGPVFSEQEQLVAAVALSHLQGVLRDPSQRFYMVEPSEMLTEQRKVIETMILADPEIEGDEAVRMELLETVYAKMPGALYDAVEENRKQMYTTHTLAA